MDVAMVLNLSDEATNTFMGFISIVIADLGVNSEVIIIWNTVLAGILIVFNWYPILVLMTLELVDT